MYYPGQVEEILFGEGAVGLHYEMGGLPIPVGGPSAEFAYYTTDKRLSGAA
jgi:hypothetical protein